METIVYDPAEIALITKARYVGLELGQRETAVDIIAMAQSEQVLNPNAARLEEIMKGNPTASHDLACEMARNGEVSRDLIYYLEENVPLVRYKGLLKRGQYGYDFNFFLEGDCEYEITRKWIDHIIGNKVYDWAMTLDGDELYFGVAVVKDRVVDPGCEIKFVDTVGEYVLEGENGELHTLLKEFSEKHPAGSRVDPVVFTSEFLDLLKV